LYFSLYQKVNTLKMIKISTLKYLRIFQFVSILTLTSILFSCKKEETIYNIPVSGPDQIFYALSDNSLYKFNALDVKSFPAKIAITGLISSSEKIISIDFRPATGDLYGLSDASKLYIIDAAGIARPVSNNAFNPGLAQNSTASLDFDPVLDRVRVVTSTGQNLNINPITATVTSVDAAINGVNGAIILGIAHNNNAAGETSTTLYNIDTKTKKLYKQEPVNDGKLIEIGNLEQDLGTNISFDISPSNTNALAVGKIGDSTKLFTIDLAKGKATLAGRFPLGTAIQGIAIPTNAVAYAVDVNNNFYTFNPENSSSLVNTKLITGLQTGETILGMDMRPLNGAIYALGSTSRLYTVNIGTGAVTQIGTATLSTLLNGSSFGFDFNPVTDRIHVVGNTGQNLTINPTDATLVVNANISPTDATLSAAAYNNNFKGATTTALYTIDHTTDKLYIQDPTTGILTVVGDIKVDINGANGFDISSTKTFNTAYAVFNVANEIGVYSINLSTGSASKNATFNKNLVAFTIGLRLP
jgi:hypothetical protein